MTEYAKSRELHKALRNVWDISLKPIGFKRCKGSVASYYRPRAVNDGFVRFWAQASQWGDSWSGNSFTLNIDIFITDPHCPFGDSDRFLGFLSEAELVEAENIAKLIMDRKPKPAADHWIYDEMRDEDERSQFWKDVFARSFNYVWGTFKPKHDIWLPYFSVEDVKLWAEFLNEPIPRLLRTLELANRHVGKPLKD